PFMSFTAEEAWPVLVGKASQGSIFFETWADLPPAEEGLLAKWTRLCEIRNLANKEIETLRTQGTVGSSLQALLRITAAPDDAALLRSLGEDLRFVTITSGAEVVDGEALAVAVTPANAADYQK